MKDFSFLPPAWERAVGHWLNTIYDHSGSKSSLVDYTSIVYRFFKFIDKDPGLATRGDVAAWLAETSKSPRNPGGPLSASSKNTRISALRSLYDYVSAYEVDGKLLYDRASPIAGFKTMKRDSQPRQMSEAEIDRLMAAIPDTPVGRRMRTLFALYLLLGRRKAELIRLRFGDISQVTIDGRPGYVYRFAQKGSSRTIEQRELPAEGYALITELLASEGRLASIKSQDFIFATSRGKRKGECLSGNYVAMYFHWTAERAGIDTSRISLHSLRWSSAYYRRISGSSLEDVRDVLGHKSVMITEHYLSGMVATSDTGAAALVNRFKWLR